MTTQDLTITDKAIVKEGVVDAPVADVWYSWTTSEGITAFLARPSKIELERGGAFEIYFDEAAEYGSKGSEGCQIISFLPYEMLSFTWNAPPKYQFVRNHEYKTWVVVQLFPETDNKTRVKVSHIGWPAGGEWDLTYDYFESAWGYVLNALQKYYNK